MKAKQWRTAIIIAALLAPPAAFTGELADALKMADAGDTRAGPILLGLLTNGQASINGLNGHLIPIAFGKLKYRPAATVLAKYLSDPVPEFAGPHEYTVGRTLDALAEIGDVSVTNAVQQYLDSGTPLFDVQFSKDLKADWGWKGKPDFRTYFPDLVERRLRWHTKQNFGTNRAQWEAWIEANIAPNGPANGSQPIRSDTDSTSSPAGSRR
jgi:hypothetical protein